MSETKDSRAFISIDEWLNENKRFNLNVAVGLLSFSTMLFHFAAVFFFTFKLKSLILVWIFLWLGNFFAFLLDVPISIFQKYAKPKTLLWLWAISQIVAMFIFSSFIFWFEFASETASEGIVDTASNFVFWGFINYLLLLLAAFCYGFNREINDITFLSYILGKANPSQYASIIAQKNLYIWIGSLAWLLLSWFILTFEPKLIIVFLIVVLVAITFASLKSFDSEEKAINLWDVKKFKVYFDKNGLDTAKKDISDSFSETKDAIVQSVKSVDLKETLWSTKYIFIKPVTVNKKMITISELAIQTKEEFIEIVKTLSYAKNTSLIVYWSFIMVLIFGFWDTFASTFLLEFLDQLKPGWSYIFLAIIALPAFALQDFFASLSEKVGVYKIANIGLFISGASLLVMSFFAGEKPELFLVMPLALLNSVWYAICMSLSVSVFLESYNKTYAQRKELTQVDANASAAPMKILQNLANVVGLVLWWIVLSIIDYNWFFALFWASILYFLFWSFKNGKAINK